MARLALQENDPALGSNKHGNEKHTYQNTNITLQGKFYWLNNFKI